jgi:hypothetical protein
MQCDTEIFCFTNEYTCDYLSGVLEPLSFVLDDETYTIPASGYLVKDYSDFECTAMVSYLPDANNMYILGDTFIRNYYTIFNYEDFTVTLATYVDSSAIETKSGGLSAGAITGIVLGVVFLIGGIVFLAWFCNPNRKKGKDTKRYVYDDSTEALTN